ncbi:unnamed protein product [marine sediment metagenome]|uniref:Uncharacterized protein n=1 Tax=marine sediment metagenome TaxID=412755 RepID=X1FIN7_9ZZZZ
MSQRKWIEIIVNFDDGWSHIIKRKDYMDTGVSLLKLDAIRAVRQLVENIDDHLVEAEAENGD